MAIPTMSIKGAQFTPSTMQFAQYNPITPDINILARSMERKDAAKNLAAQQKTELDKTLKDVEDKLNEDEIDWFNQYKQDIDNQIKAEAEASNLNSAIRTATMAAGDLLTDSVLNNKIKTNTDYVTKKQKVLDNANFSDLSKERWVATNKYKFDGSATWKSNYMPVKHIPLNVIQLMAAQMTEEESGSSAGGETSSVMLDAKGNPTNTYNQNNKIIGTSSGSSKNEYNRKTKDMLERTFNHLMDNGQIRASLSQEFNDYVWAYNDRIQKANNSELSEEEKNALLVEAASFRQMISDDNGIFLQTEDGFMNWVKTKAVPMFESLSYNRIGTARTRGTVYDNSSAPRGYGGVDGYQGNYYDSLPGQEGDAVDIVYDAIKWSNDVMRNNHTMDGKTISNLTAKDNEQSNG